MPVASNARQDRHLPSSAHETVTSDEKLKLLPRKRSLQNLHETMKYIYEVDELMYFRLRRMLDGA